MPVTLTDKLVPYDTFPNRIRWTRQQCDTMREMGFLTGRYELIDGEILSKTGQKPLHSLIVVLLHAWLITAFGPLHVRCQLPVNVAEEDNERNEPEPDGAALKQPITAYSQQHPGPNDLYLVAEVSDTTLRYDMSTKANLYAHAGIQEYWVIDMEGRQIFVHRQPQPTGYGEVVGYTANEDVACLARPDRPVRVSDLLPPS